MATREESNRLPEKLPPTTKPTILLVDDRAANRLALRAILDELGLNLVDAESGEQALRHLQEGEFALIMLDVQMPGLDGFETAKRIRIREESRRTPIIFLTAYDSDRFAIEQAYSLGAVDYLIKPLNPIIVRAKVTGFVELFEKTLQVKRQAEQIRLMERRDFEEKLAKENALLRERVRLAAFGRDAAQALVQNDTLPDMLHLCAEAMVRHLEGAFARIWTLSPDETVLELQASAGLYTHLNGRHSRVPVGKYKIGLIAEERKPHLTNAIANDLRVSDKKWAEREGMVAFAGYPLIVADRLVGVMAMFARQPLSDATLEAMASVANGIALGIERQRSEERLRVQREWLRVTLVSIGDGVIATDTAGRVTFLNPVAQELTGWTENEAQGLPLNAIFHILHEDTRQVVEDPVSKVLRSGTVVGLGNHTILIARNGTERPIDDSAAPIKDATGSTAGVVLIFRDVTDQRRNEKAVRESEARKAAILATALDCIITIDHEGKVLEFNPAAEQTFGYRRAQAVGQELANLIIPPSLRQRHREGIAHHRTTGEAPVLNQRLEMPALRADGTEIPVELAITRINIDGPPLFTAYLRDISERTRMEVHRNVRLGVNQVLAQALTIPQAASGVLRAICESLGWEMGFFWTHDGDAGVLRYLEGWHRPDIRAPEFLTTCRQRTFRRGEGLPGTLWATGTSAWIVDVANDSNFSGLAIAGEGLHGAFGCAVVQGTQILGVIEFFSRQIREPDAELTETMATVASQIGQFMERMNAEERLRQSESELADFFENSAVGLHWVGLDGIILRANQAELDLLGYNVEEYVGHSITEFHADADVIDDILCRLQGGETLNNYEARLRCKDGSIRHVLIVSNVFRKEGRFVHTRCFTRDITARKQAEEALRESEQRFARFMQHLPGLAWVKDVQGRYVYANDAALKVFRMPNAVLYGKTDDDIFPTATAAQFRENDRRALASGTGLSLIESLEHEDGVLHSSLVSKFPIPGVDGKSGLMGGIAIDITDRLRAEAALREADARLAAIIDHSPSCIFAKDRQGRYTLANRALARMVNREPDELIGRNDREFFPSEVAARFAEDDAKVILTGQPVIYEESFPHEGTTVTALTAKFPLVDSEGNVYAVCGIATDITAHRKAETALQESDLRFRQLADAMPQIVWSARPDGNIDYLNRRWTEFTGLPETVGNEGWGQILHPDEVRAANERWAESVRSGAPFEMEMRLRDRRHQDFRWHLIRTVAVHDASGNVVRWFGTSTDINEQKRAQESSRYLAEASAALASVVDYESTLQKIANLAVPYFADWSAVDVAKDGSLRRLAVAHRDAKKVELALQLMRQYPPDPQAASGAFAVVRTGKPEIVGDITDELLMQGAKDEQHLRLIRSLCLKSYICVPLIVAGSPFGALTFATAESGRRYTNADLALATDLALRAAVAVENTQLYQALRDADRRKDEFLATLAHELRNPLAPIRNSLQILKMPRVDAETVRRSHDMMERQVHHLVRLVDDLLDVSRVMRGKIELRRERVEIAAVVARAVETAQPLVDAEGHQLTIRLPTTSLPIDADPVRLAQVVGNLLTNAAKYTEPNGRIWLTADREGGMIVLRIRDNGIGIAPHMLPRIFELFVQADHATTKAQGGLGIGLTLVKNLVEMHKGTVEAHSEGLGKGSEFVVRLPIAAHGLERQTSSEKEQQGPPPSHSGYRLLVVDDNQDAANSLAILLRLHGHDVRVAYSGTEALEMTKVYLPDMVFLDIGMPGMDGYEVARRIRNMPGLEKTVLAALTGWGQQEDRRRTAEAGFTHHLVKPPEPKALEELLASLERRAAP